VTPKTWWLCGFLFLATVLNYVDRQVLALTPEKVIAEFNLTKQAFGEVISAFRYSYGAVQIAGGWLVDKYGPRVVYPLAVGLWSLAGILTALCELRENLSGFRFLLNIGGPSIGQRSQGTSASATTRSASG
jgi:MFS family permease